MQKTLLVDLKRKMYLRSALLGINGFEEILGINDAISGDEVLLEIIKQALREFELSEPLILEMPVNLGQLGTCYGRAGYVEIKPNFTLFLDCIIPEHRIILMPTSLPCWRLGDNSFSQSFTSYYSGSSIPQPGAYTYFTDWQAPYLFVGDLGLYGNRVDDIIIKSTCARPIIPGFTTDRKFSSQGAIYWMDVETGGANGNFFMDMCMVHLLNFIRQQKAALSLPSLAVDVFANVDSAYMELRSKVDQYILQSGWKGELIF